MAYLQTEVQTILLNRGVLTTRSYLINPTENIAYTISKLYKQYKSSYRSE